MRADVNQSRVAELDQDTRNPVEHSAEVEGREDQMSRQNPAAGTGLQEEMKVGGQRHPGQGKERKSGKGQTDPDPGDQRTQRPASCHGDSAMLRTNVGNPSSYNRLAK